MKKKRAVAGGLLLVLGIAQSVSAGTTTVTYHVDPSYMVLVPANTTIPFNEESVNYVSKKHRSKKENASRWS